MRLLLWLSLAGSSPLPAQTVAAWGDNSSGQCNVPEGLSGVVAVAAGDSFSLAVRSDGTVAAWGNNFNGQCNVPNGLSGVVAVAAGKTHALALKSDGTVVEWGSLKTVLTGLSGVVAVAAGDNRSLILRRDGTVEQWGDSGSRPVPPGLNGVVAIAASGRNSMAVRGDGTVVSWGGTDTVPGEVSEVVMVKSGGAHNLALRKDGTVVSWKASGENDGNITVPPGLSDVVAVAAGERQVSLALRRDGSVEEWGGEEAGGPPPMPAGLSGVTAIAAGGRHFLALRENQDQAPVILSPREAVAPSGGGFYYRIAASAPVTAYHAAGLPEGLTLNSSSGVITGVPAHEGKYPVTLSVTGSQGTGEGLLTLNVSGKAAIRAPNVVEWDPVTGGSRTTGFLPDAVAVSTGAGGHSLALRSDGTVAAWGACMRGPQFKGQSIVPEGLSDVVAIAAGNYHSLALKADGTVVAWGDNLDGQCAVPPGLSDVTAIAAGNSHSLALRRDGTVAAWGFCTLPAGLAGVTAIAAGSYFSAALKRDGSVMAWHSNPAFPPAAGLSDIMAVSILSREKILALKPDGTMVLWKTGPGAGTVQTVAPAALAGVVAISTDTSGFLALKGDGTVLTCSLSVSDEVSIAPSGMSGAVAISAAGGRSLALLEIPDRAPSILSSREMTATGGFDHFYYRIVTSSRAVSFTAEGLPEGLVLDGSTGIITGTPVQSGSFKVLLSAVNSFGAGQAELMLTVTGVPAYSATSIPVNWTLGRPVPGRLYASGNPAYSATGLPPGTGMDPATGAILGAPERPGVYHAVLTLSNAFGTATRDWDIWVSNVAAWGTNISGEGVPAGISLASAVAAGYNHSLVLKSDGTVAAWGSNAQGQCDVPAGLTGVTAIAGGYAHSLVLRSDGTVTAWGDNAKGQCDVPPGLSGVVAVAAGYRHSLALMSDGTVTAWGDNALGQCAVPPGLSGVTALAAGESHSVALKDDGTAEAWGSNGWKQCDVPPGLSDVVAIASGQDHSLALGSDGTVTAWGADFTKQSTVPSGLADVTAISAGIYYSMALKRDGTMVTWGSGGAVIDLKGAVAISTRVGSRFLGLTGPVITLPPTVSTRISLPFSYQAVSSWPDLGFSAVGLPAGVTLDPVTGVVSGSAAAAGRWDTVLTARDPATGLSTKKTVRMYVVDAGFAEWQARFFPAAGDPDALSGADPDADGMANILEYARGTDPLVKDGEATASPASGAGGELEVYLEVLSPVAEELEVSAQFADDPAFADPLQISTPVKNWTVINGYQRIGFSDAAAGPRARRFGRLSISLRPSSE